LGGAIGTLNQNTTGSSGSCTGNAATATTASNSNTVGGFTPSATAGVGNRVVLADASGYIFNSYFNSSDNAVGSGVSAVLVKQGDNYYRSGTAASIATFISGQSMNISGSSTSTSGSSASCTGNAATATALSTASGSAPSYSARAWVNFNGTGTVAIRANGNVSSITDNGTGDYTVNFSTAMSDANYAAMGCAQFNQDGGGPPAVWIQLSRNAQTSSAVRFQCSIYEGTVFDMTTVTVAVFR